ncbi:hypothetical protein roselon_02081 [Roseibacterium elongatum DSM 19469]|uniref:Uncharacterized protein n=1 Tax=Roseicyclus elongatus DSM 19469 TaxID=1294273 RepID=W8S2N0_9RHOB|nr:hypothetical protein roselon_02081 [Roseibacterium elongatum DSM 19469]
MLESDKITAGRVFSDHPFHGLIEEAYRVFDAPPPIHLGICTCGMCMGPDVAARLLRRPARNWTLADVWSWHDSVEEGLEQRVWSWLLPRFLEILAAGDTCHNGLYERSLIRFPTGQKSLWSDRQWAVLDRFAGMMLERGMQRRNGPDVFYELHMLAHGGWPIRDLIAKVMADPDLPEALAYAWGCGLDICDSLGPNWPPGAWDALHEAFITQELADRMLAYGLMDGLDPKLSDRALRAAEAIQCRL